MPVATCPDCQRCFIIEDERSFQRTCPSCLRPMQMTAWEGTPARSVTPRFVHSPGRPDEEGHLWRNGTPLAADEQGQRLMAAIAEAAYQRGLAQARRSTAQRSPQEAGAAADDGDRAAAIPPPGAAPPESRGQGGDGDEPTSLQRWAVLVQQSLEIVERSQAARQHASAARERLRLAREARKR